MLIFPCGSFQNITRSGLWGLTLAVLQGALQSDLLLVAVVIALIALSAGTLRSGWHAAPAIAMAAAAAMTAAVGVLELLLATPHWYGLQGSQHLQDSFYRACQHLHF